jgi:hypothetical protein
LRQEDSVTSEFEHLRADDATLAARRELVQRVCTALTYAGVPAFPSDGVSARPGAAVEVDGGNDEAGGVYVWWKPSPELSRTVVDNLTADRTDDPADQLFLSISLAMRDAMMLILRQSGLRVGPVDDFTQAPPGILVLGPGDDAMAA